MLTGLQGGQNSTRPEAGEVGPEVGVLRMDAPVCPRIGEDEQEAVRRVVAQFHRVTPDGCLNVSKPHLELDRTAFAVSKDQRVPSTQLGRLIRPLRKGDVESVLERRANVGQDPPQALGVRGITERRPSWICPHNQFQTENTGDARGIHDRETMELGPFQPTDLRGRHGHRVTERGLTEAGADPCLTGFVTQLSEAPVPPLASAIESSLD